jgi:hypothetical protein
MSRLLVELPKLEYATKITRPISATRVRRVEVALRAPKFEGEQDLNCREARCYADLSSQRRN